MPHAGRLLIPVALLVLAGCSGGSDPINPGPQPPTITAITPSPDAGGPGELVTFRGTATNSPTSWRWDFGGGATPNASIEATPEVRLSNSLATFTGTVTARNAAGESQPFRFTYRIAHGLPRVNAVLQGGTLGAPGRAVEFAAIASNRPTAWQWDFGGGTDPGTSTAELPEVRLKDPGTYQGTLTVSNATGSSAPFAFSYTVGPLLPSPVFSVSPQGRIGDAGSTQTFQAGLDRNALGLRWSFGAGTTPAESTELTPTVTLAAPGLYEGSLQVETEEGLTEPFRFKYMVEGPAGVPPAHHVFSLHTVEPTYGSFAMAVAGGVPIVLFTSYDQFTGDSALFFGRATTPTPSDPAHWQKHRVDTVSGWAPQVAMSPSGRPFVTALTWQFPFQVRASVPATSTPDSSDDWQTYPIALNHFADAGHTMRMVAGRPVVAFQSTSQGGLWVAHTGVELPDDLADWNIHQVDPGNIAEVSSVVDHGGRIAVSTVGGPSFDALVVALAQVNTPSVAQDWALHRVDGPGVFGSSMVRHRGKLAATYAKNGSYHVALAKVDQPAFGSDWNRMDLLIPVSGNIGRTISTQGKLALVYPMISGFCEVCPLGETLPNELRIAWNATAAPTSALDWQTAQITELPMSNLLVANNGATLLVAGTPDFFFPGGGRGE